MLHSRQALANTPLLRVRNLRKTFSKQRSLFGAREFVHAVDDVDLDIRAGETVGLVGESGSGKSTLGRTILNLTAPSGGKVEFEGRDLGELSRSAMRSLRRKMQIVFQDPYSSLHPRMTVRETLYEGLLAGGEIASQSKANRVKELINAVGLGPQHLDVYPHKLSGGQRQRVAIARALSVKPTLIVADEPVSALDVSIQAQILNLLADIQEEFGLTYLFVSHDLNVIRYLADTIVVLYHGRVVEQAPAHELFRRPRHPYTQLLFRAMPRAEQIGQGFEYVPEEISTAPRVPYDACPFYPRCPFADENCLAARPKLRSIGPEHRVACIKDVS